MTDFGIQAFRLNGSVSVDSTNKAGVYIETLTLVGNQSGSKVYPDIPAGYMYHILTAAKGYAHTITVGDDGTGQSKITWSASVYATQYDTTTVTVFARRITSYGFGAAILNADGDYLADLNYPVPQFNSTITSDGAYTRITTTGGGTLYESTYPGNGGSMVLMNLPDSANDNLWYAFNPYSGAYDNRKVYVFYPSGFAQYVKLPSLHNFTLGNPTSSGSSFGMQCFNSSSGLTYDSSNENIVIKDTTSITFNNKTSTPTPASYTLALPPTCGFIVPFYKEKWYNDFNNPDGSIVEYWLSLYQRKGNTIYSQLKLMAGTQGMGQSTATYLIREGTPYGGGGIFSDISQLNPAPNIISVGGV